MKKALLYGLALCLVLVALPQTAAAHVLKENNGVAVVLHIAPDDNPMAGQDTTLELSFGSDNGAFSLAHCNCMLAVRQSGRQLSQTSIQPVGNAATEGRATVHFPFMSVYDVVVSGTATDGSFAAFRLDYEVRVARASGSNGIASGSGLAVLLMGATSILLLGMLAYTYIRRGGRYAKKGQK